MRIHNLILFFFLPFSAEGFYVGTEFFVSFHHDNVGRYRLGQRRFSVPPDRISLSVLHSTSSNALDKTTVSVEKPMGIVIEEIDLDNPTGGVRIASVNPEGNAAKISSKMILCVHDIILAVNGVPSENKTFDQIMDEIRQTEMKTVALTLGRDSEAAIISFPNGINVAAKPGEYLGNIAQTALYNRIPYKCKAGGCGTCEQSVIVDGKGPRLMCPCVAQIPKKCKSIEILTR
mmetsp:Transcript_8236/g.11986  ORF Transcript_8236/g.11986 Transcript_8236/m.11986 type:complete len:232 (-) Transcript_8236:2351-3046(-)